MNSDDLKKINKGIPIYSPITIYANDLLELTEDKEKLEKDMNKEFDSFFAFLEPFTQKHGIHFFLTMCLISNKETLEKELQFSQAGYMNSLLYGLNVDDICQSDQYKSDTTKSLEDYVGKQGEKLDKRIQDLRNLGMFYKEQLDFYALKYQNNKKEMDSIKDKMKTITDKKEKNQWIAKLKTKEKNQRRNTRKIKEIIEIMELKLEKEFPELKNQYIDFRENCKTLMDWKLAIQDSTLDKRKQLEERLLSSLKEQGIHTNLDNLFSNIERPLYRFCMEYADTFQRLVDHTDEVLDYLSSHSIKLDNLKIDFEKLELYVANQALSSCEEGNKEDKQRYIYYVADYFKKNKQRKKDNTLSISLTTNKKAKEQVTPESLYKRYRDFLMTNPEIKVIDLSNFDFTNRNLVEVKTMIENFIKDLQANWEILPPDVFEKEIVNFMKNSTEGLNEEEKKRHLEKLAELYIEKKEFYGRTDPFYRVKGKKTFNGYIGFIYSNGKVVLDKFFEDYSTGKLADGEAIYIMDMNDFQRLSAYSKSVLIKDPSVTRIIHYGNWQGRVQNIIEEKKNNIDTKEAVKQLIKTKQLEESK